MLQGRFDHGGGIDAGFPLYRAISQNTPELMAENVRKYVDEGYQKFQLKVGNKPSDDIARIHAVRKVLDAQTAATGHYHPLLCDANAGWLRHEAMQVEKRDPFFESHTFVPKIIFFCSCCWCCCFFSLTLSLLFFVLFLSMRRGERGGSSNTYQMFFSNKYLF
jgi:hypothetical protein